VFSAVEKNTAAPRRARGWKKTLLFILTPLVILIAVGEIVIRLAGLAAPDLDPTVYSNVPGDLTPRQDLIHVHPNTGVTCRIHVNDQGFRGAGRLNPGSPCRILCLGDSSMMGYGVDEGYTAPDLLRSWLDQTWPGVFDVLNAASIGYTIDDQLEYLKEKGLALKPDVVLLEIFYNDVNEKAWREEARAGHQRRFRKSSVPYTPLRSLILRSALFQFARGRMIAIMIRSGNYFPANRADMMDVAMRPSRHPEAWKAYDGVLKEMISLLQEKDIPLIVVITPHQYQLHRWGYPVSDYFGVREYQDHLLSLLVKEGIPSADLMPVFLDEMKTVPSLYLTGGMYDEHPDARGQYLKARELHRLLSGILRDRGFINFFDDFENADTSGDVHQGRLWRPSNDAPCLALRPGSSVSFPSIHAGASPLLRFLPVWTGDGDASRGILRLRCLDSSTSHVMVLETTPMVFENRLGRSEWNLSPLSGRTVTFEWEFSPSERELSKQSGEIYIMSPHLISAPGYEPAWERSP